MHGYGLALFHETNDSQVSLLYYWSCFLNEFSSVYVEVKRALNNYIPHIIFIKYVSFVQGFL